MKSFDKLLLIISERIGDVIFCTPAIDFLKSKLPRVLLDVIAPNEAVADVLANNPALNTIYVNPPEKILRLLDNQYDAILDFHNNKATQHYYKNMQMPVFASPRAKTNVHQSMVATEFIANVLEIETPKAQPYLLYPQPKNFEKIEQLLAKHNVDYQEEILIGCHMGTNKIARQTFNFLKKESEHKAWPFENFVVLEKKLRQVNPKIRFVLTGTLSEQLLCQKLSKHSDTVIDLSGQTSVLDLVALMEKLHLFLTGDTGPLHIASATSKPIIALFGITSPIETGPHPLKEHHHILHASSINDISVEDVYEIIMKNRYFEKK